MSTDVERNNRKVKQGTVVSNKMQKTVVVKVRRTFAHPRYGKKVNVDKKYYAHYDGELLPVGAEVKIMETRPLSKLKRWLVIA